MRPPVPRKAHGVTFVELFFDLPFVFASTRTMAVFHSPGGEAGHEFTLLVAALAAVMAAIAVEQWTLPDASPAPDPLGPPAGHLQDVYGG